MKYVVLSIIAILAIPGISFAKDIGVTSKTLKTFLERQNAKVTASKMELDATLQREGYLLRSYLPTLDISGSQETFKAGSVSQKSQLAYGAEVKVNLFSGGRDQIENRVRSLESEKRSYSTKRIISEELDKAWSTYWQALYLRDKVKLISSSLEVNMQNLKAAQRRIKSGVATDSDRFEFEMKDVELRRDTAEARAELSLKMKLLAMLLGFEQDENALLTEQFGHDHDYEALLKHSESDHDFTFKELEIQSEQLNLKSQIAARSWWPKVDAFAAFNQYNERERDAVDATERKESVLGLRASLSLSGGFEEQRESAALSKEASASRVISSFQKRETEVHLFGELEELKLLHGQVHEAEENISRAERYYKLTQSEYGRGVKNSPDVLGASEKLFAMQHKRLEIVRDFQLAKSHILSKIGK